MIKDFGFIIPQNCQFGVGALKKLPDFLKAAGSDNVMLISDRGLEAIGVVEKVRKIIKDADLKYAEYLDVLPNPTTTIVDECAAKYKEAGCTALIALGGGSPMDTSKAIGIIINNPEFADVRSLEGVADTKKPCVPILSLIHI